MSHSGPRNNGTECRFVAHQFFVVHQSDDAAAFLSRPSIRIHTSLTYVACGGIADAENDETPGTQLLHTSSVSLAKQKHYTSPSTKTSWLYWLILATIMKLTHLALTESRIIFCAATFWTRSSFRPPSNKCRCHALPARNNIRLNALKLSSPLRPLDASRR